MEGSSSSNVQAALLQDGRCHPEPWENSGPQWPWPVAGSPSHTFDMLKPSPDGRFLVLALLGSNQETPSMLKPRKAPLRSHPNPKDKPFIQCWIPGLEALNVRSLCNPESSGSLRNPSVALAASATAERQPALDLMCFRALSGNSLATFQDETGAFRLPTNWWFGLVFSQGFKPPN